MHHKGKGIFNTLKIFLFQLPKILIKRKILPLICKPDIKNRKRKSLKICTFGVRKDKFLNRG